jgi:sodium transport system permease protein
MKNVLTVFKKEIRRYFTDRRMLMALFLPGILIFVIYTVVGRVFSTINLTGSITQTTYHIAYTDNSGAATSPLIVQSFEAYLQQSEDEKTNSASYKAIPVSNVETYKQEVAQGKYDVLVVFSDDFENKITVRDGSFNYIHIYYNGASSIGSHAYEVMLSLADNAYKNYFVNIGSDGKPITPNVGSSDFLGAKLMSVLLPMATMSLLFSSVVSICPDAVAGEKERGTLSAMLLTPIKRGELAIGKILAISVVSLASGITAFLGLALSLPNLMQGLNFTLTAGMVAFMGVLVVTTLLLFVSIGMVVSTFAKSVKECSSLMAPFMILAIGASFLPFIVSSKSLGLAFVPFANIALSMSTLLETGSVDPLFFATTVGVNLVLTGALIFVVSRLFKVERIMIK